MERRNDNKEEVISEEEKKVLNQTLEKLIEDTVGDFKKYNINEISHNILRLGAFFGRGLDIYGRNKMNKDKVAMKKDISDAFLLTLRERGVTNFDVNKVGQFLDGKHDYIFTTLLKSLETLKEDYYKKEEVLKKERGEEKLIEEREREEGVAGQDRDGGISLADLRKKWAEQARSERSLEVGSEREKVSGKSEEEIEEIKNKIILDTVEIFLKQKKTDSQRVMVARRKSQELAIVGRLSRETGLDRVKDKEKLENLKNEVLSEVLEKLQIVEKLGESIAEIGGESILEEDMAERKPKRGQEGIVYGGQKPLASGKRGVSGLDQMRISNGTYKEKSEESVDPAVKLASSLASEMVKDSREKEVEARKKSESEDVGGVGRKKGRDGSEKRMINDNELGGKNATDYGIADMPVNKSQTLLDKGTGGKMDIDDPFINPRVRPNSMGVLPPLTPDEVKKADEEKSRLEKVTVENFKRLLKKMTNLRSSLRPYEEMQPKTTLNAPSYTINLNRLIISFEDLNDKFDGIKSRFLDGTKINSGEFENMDQDIEEFTKSFKLVQNQIGDEIIEQKLKRDRKELPKKVAMEFVADEKRMLDESLSDKKSKREKLQEIDKEISDWGKKETLDKLDEILMDKFSAEWAKAGNPVRDGRMHKLYYAEVESHSEPVKREILEYLNERKSQVEAMTDAAEDTLEGGPGLDGLESNDLVMEMEEVSGDKKDPYSKIDVAEALKRFDEAHKNEIEKLKKDLEEKQKKRGFLRWLFPFGNRSGVHEELALDKIKRSRNQLEKKLMRQDARLQDELIGAELASKQALLAESSINRNLELKRLRREKRGKHGEEIDRAKMNYIEFRGEAKRKEIALRKEKLRLARETSGFVKRNFRVWREKVNDPEWRKTVAVRAGIAMCGIGIGALLAPVTATGFAAAAAVGAVKGYGAVGARQFVDRKRGFTTGTKEELNSNKKEKLTGAVIGALTMGVGAYFAPEISDGFKWVLKNIGLGGGVAGEASNLVGKTPDRFIPQKDLLSVPDFSSITNPDTEGAKLAKSITDTLSSSVGEISTDDIVIPNLENTEDLFKAAFSGLEGFSSLNPDQQSAFIQNLEGNLFNPSARVEVKEAVMRALNIEPGTKVWNSILSNGSFKGLDLDQIIKGGEFNRQALEDLLSLPLRGSQPNGLKMWDTAMAAALKN